MATAKDEHVKALDKVLKEIKKDPEGFIRNPLGKVPELDPKAAKEFQAMTAAELRGLVDTDEAMKKVGYTVSGGGVSVRMV